MASITAAAGGGNWTTGASWVGGVAPTAADDALLTSASGNITIDSGGAVCRSLDCNTYTGTLTHNASATLTIGDATAGAGSRALRLATGMTYTINSATTSLISFISTSATQQTITSNGKTMPSFTVNGVGSSYLLADAQTIAATSTFTLTSGTFNTGSVACSWGFFSYGGANARTITLGSSALSITGSGNGILQTAGAGTTTYTSNTAIATFSGTSGAINAGANWNGLSLVFTSSNTTSASILNGGTYNNVTVTGPANKTGSLNISASLTVTGTLTVTGNSAVNRIHMISATQGTAFTVTTAAFSLSNVDFRDITAAGGGGTWTGTSLGDCLGNTNITTTTPATQTHTSSAGGSWSDSSKWTSRVPLPQDDVVVDVNTTGTLTQDMPRSGKNVNFTGFAGTLSLGSQGTTIYGGYTLASGMTISGANAMQVFARSSVSLTNAGKQWPGTLNLKGFGSANFSLVDAVSTASTLFVGGGGSSTFTTNGQSVTCSVFEGSATSTFTMALGASAISLTSTTNGGTNTAMWFVSSSVTVTGTSTITLSSASASSRTFIGGGKTYGTLTYTVAGSTGALVITGANTFDTINFSDVTNARTITFPASTTTTITTLFNVNGTSGKLMSITSSTPGTKATLSKSSGVVSCDYLSITDSTATGGASWLAGANSVDN